MRKKPNPPTLTDKQLAQTRLAIASTRMETLRTLPHELGFENAQECLRAFCVVHDLEVPTFREYLFRQSAKKRVEVLIELPAIFGFKTAKDMITALCTAHGENAGRRILTPEKIDRLIELTAENATREQIAEELGCAAQTISNVRNELGIKQTARHRTTPTILEAHGRSLLELTAQGLSTEECAHALGCSRTSIPAFRRKLGISHASKAARMAAARQMLADLDRSESSDKRTPSAGAA